MKAFTDQLFNELHEELALYADLGASPVRRVTGAIQSIQTALAKLKAYLVEHPFADHATETLFFKHDKPRFIAEHYYAMEIFTIETARPIHDASLLKIFYEQELAYVRHFFEQNRFLYTYYQFDIKDLDHLLFMRFKRPADIPIPDDIGHDPDFSACCDHLWGKFMAFERLQDWLIAELESLQHPGAQEGSQLIWTGGVVNLVELAYGIWLTGQLNNGNATISQIITWLEVHLHVKIGRPHRRWETISTRKRLSITKFIDQMAEAIRKRLDDENGR